MTRTRNIDPCTIDAKQIGERLQRLEHVINCEDSHALHRDCRLRLQEWLILVTVAWQPDRKGCALVKSGGRRLYPTPLSHGQFSDQCKAYAQPRTLAAAGLRRLHGRLRKHMKHMRQKRGGYAATGIDNPAYRIAS